MAQGKVSKTEKIGKPKGPVKPPKIKKAMKPQTMKRMGRC